MPLALIAQKNGGVLTDFKHGLDVAFDRTAQAAFEFADTEVRVAGLVAFSKAVQIVFPNSESTQTQLSKTRLVGQIAKAAF